MMLEVARSPRFYRSSRICFRVNCARVWTRKGRGRRGEGRGGKVVFEEAGAPTRRCHVLCAHDAAAHPKKTTTGACVQQRWWRAPARQREEEELCECVCGGGWGEAGSRKVQRPVCARGTTHTPALSSRVCVSMSAMSKLLTHGERERYTHPCTPTTECRTSRGPLCVCAYSSEGSRL